MYDLTDDYGGEIEIINDGETFVFYINNYLKSFSNISNLRGTTRKSSMNFNNDFYFNKKIGNNRVLENGTSDDLMKLIEEDYYH